MKRKKPIAPQPGIRLYFLLLLLFAMATFFLGGRGTILAAAEVGIIAIALIYSRVMTRKRDENLLKYVESVMENMDSATKASLSHSPLPVMIYSFDSKLIMWSNRRFMTMTGDREHFFEVSIESLVPGFSDKWLFEGKSEMPEFIEIGGRKYRVYGSLLRTEREHGIQKYAAITFWVDVTELADIRDEFFNTRPVVATVMLDNYDELFKTASEKEKAAMLADIDDKLTEWVGDTGSLLCRYNRDKYLLICEEQVLAEYQEAKFSLLESMRKIVSPGGVAATVSLGIGKDGSTLRECFDFAGIAIEMALSRGGDQAVIKNRFTFEFFGGLATEVEKRTKVKSRVIANAFGELVSDASSVYIMGHKMADLDSVGSAAGIVCIARKRGVPAYIVVDRETNVSKELIARLEKTQEYDGVFISAQTAILEADSKSLLVVVDTNRPEQVESQALLESCNRIAVIDHHRRAATYIEHATLNFHEPYASSAAELVTEMLQYLVDQSEILRSEAEALLCGIVLDTKSFAIRTGSRTFDAAAFLRRAGADTIDVKRMMQSDFDTAIARYSLIRSAHIYREGIAIAASQVTASRVVIAQAADELLNIAGVQTSFVIAQGDSGDVFISGRSLNDVNVQVILERLNGGGNQSTAGAQIKDKTVDSVLSELAGSIDKYFEDKA